jgi:hypothetical protein
VRIGWLALTLRSLPLVDAASPVELLLTVAEEPDGIGPSGHERARVRDGHHGVPTGHWRRLA